MDGMFLFKQYLNLNMVEVGVKYTWVRPGFSAKYWSKIEKEEIDQKYYIASKKCIAWSNKVTFIGHVCIHK
jgi:hypothetical protein